MLVITVLAALVPALAAGVAVRASRRGGALRRRLRLAAAGFGLLSLGFGGFHLQWWLEGSPQVPAVSDPVLALGYLVLVAAWWPHLRGGGPLTGARRRAALLDAALVVVGPATVVAAVVVDPMLRGHALPHLAVLILYPLLDLALLTCVVHAALTGLLGRVQAVLWAAGALGMLLGDCLFFLTLRATESPAPLVACLPYGLALASSAAAAALRGPGEDDAAPLPWAVRPAPAPRRRLVLVSVSSCLPALALVVEGAAGLAVDWAVLGGGALLTAVLAALRLHWALTASQAQAEALDQLVRIDELTGLPNRRELLFTLHSAVADPAAEVVVAVLDLDHFKRVNDTGGHAAGDRLLRQAARAWQAHLPATARLHRWGGEEFVVVFLASSPAAAGLALEAARAATPAPHTVSVGVATRRPGEPAAELLVRADDNLYRAKAAGRDRLVSEVG